MKGVYECCHLYHGKYVGVRTSKVVFNESHQSMLSASNDNYDNFKDVPIPLFHHIRVVTVNRKGVMFCNCFMFKRRWYFCVHQLCVVDLLCKEVGSKFEGFIHHDIALQYRSNYMHFAYKKSTPNCIQAIFHRMATKDIKGPTLCHEIPNSLEIKPSSPPLAAIKRLKNCNKNDII